MSILIKDMKMPKGNYYIDIRLFSDGWAHIPTDEPPYYNKAFEVTELPPHGRLIDADALAVKDNADYEDAMASIADVSSRSIVCQIHYGAQKMIAEADTIIPADGGADG